MSTSIPTTTMIGCPPCEYDEPRFIDHDFSTQGPDLYVMCLETLTAQQTESGLGDLSKLPLEIRTQILKYILVLSSSEKDYLKGQHDDTNGRAYRTRVLRTSKALYVESSMVLFSTNHFLLSGTYHVYSYEYNWESGVWIRLSLLIDKRADPETRYPVGVQVEGHSFNLINHNRVSPDLLSRIQFLAVAIDGNDTYKNHGDHRREEVKHASTRFLPWTSPAKLLPEHVLDIRKFLLQCNQLKSLHIEIFNGSICGFPASLCSRVLNQLAVPIGAKKVELFTYLDMCHPEHDLSHMERLQRTKQFILSVDFHNYLRNSLYMQKGSKVAAFNGTEFFQKVARVKHFYDSEETEDEWGAKEQKRLESEVGGEIDYDKLVLTKSGWTWK